MRVCVARKRRRAQMLCADVMCGCPTLLRLLLQGRVIVGAGARSAGQPHMNHARVQEFVSGIHHSAVLNNIGEVPSM